MSLNKLRINLFQTIANNGEGIKLPCRQRDSFNHHIVGGITPHAEGINEEKTASSFLVRIAQIIILN